MNSEVSKDSLFSENIIAGFSSFSEIKVLAVKGLIGGIFITARNIRGKSIDSVAADLRELQNIRKKAGLTQLFICADQEGGRVSRLSPPLPVFKSPGEIIKEDVKNRDTVLLNYSIKKARYLKKLGVNMNLSPVVDLKHNIKVKNFDLFSQISKRAISDKMTDVAHYGLIYSKGHLQHKVIPVLKHFPGIGAITEDTHFFSPVIETYGYNDLYPFINIARKSRAAIMLSHIKVESIDRDETVSCSYNHVQYIRKKITQNTLLVTDDFSMGPIYYSFDGPSGKAVKALKNGVDLILISYDDELIYSVLYNLNKEVKRDTALLKALKQSRERIMRYKRLL